MIVLTSFSQTLLGLSAKTMCLHADKTADEMRETHSTKTKFVGMQFGDYLCWSMQIEISTRVMYKTLQCT